MAQPRVDWRLDDRLDPWARWLDQALQDGPTDRHQADAEDQAVEERPPRLVLVPSAACVLGRAAIDGKNLDDQRRTWLHETRRLLREHQAAPGRVLLLLGDELQAQPLPALETLRTALGQPSTPASVLAGDCPAAQDELPGTLLAAQWVRADHELALVWDELLASCLPLTPDDEPSSERPLSATALAQALAAHGAAVRGQRAALRLEALQAERDALAHAAAETGEQVRALEQRCQALTQSLSELQSRSAGWDDQRLALTNQLGDLARTHEAAMVEARRVAAELAAQLAARDSALSALEQAQSQQQHALVHAVGAQQAAESACTALQQRLEAQEDAAATAQREMSERLAAVALERDEQARLHHENAQWAIDLQQQASDLQAALDEARAQARSLADDKAMLIARLQQLEQQVQDQAAASSALEQQRRGQIHVLEQSHRQLQDEHQLRDLQFAQALEELQAARVAAAALQQQLTAQTAAAEDASRQWTQRLGELTQERDTEAKWHRDNAQWARGLERQVAELKSQLQDEQLRAAALSAREQEAAAQAAAARVIDEERLGQLQSLQQTCEALRADHRLSQLQLAQALEELQGLNQHHEHRRHATDGAQEAERALLAAQLQAAISELEALHGTAPEPASALRQLSTEPLEVVHVRDEPPHRELSLVFRDVQTPTGMLPRLLVRLVEHAGHPGLVLFRPAGGPPPLTQWQAAGTEASEEFMILLPEDASAASPLSGLASPNWRFVQSLVDTLAQEVPQSDDVALHPHWPAIAIRLQQQFAALPPRLRYADLQAHQAQDDLSVCFRDVVFGRNAWPTARLQWRLADSGLVPALTWQLGADDTHPPLVSWPTRADGTFDPDYPLKLGRAFPNGAKQDWWARLPAADRALVSAILDALPALAATPGASPGIQAAAAALRRDVARTTNSMRLRHQARRLMRRVTQLG